jgi:hypothetical protein
MGPVGSHAAIEGLAAADALGDPLAAALALGAGDAPPDVQAAATRTTTPSHQPLASRRVPRGTSPP